LFADCSYECMGILEQELGSRSVACGFEFEQYLPYARKTNSYKFKRTRKFGFADKRREIAHCAGGWSQ
jgi:hypothetical protein